MWFSTAVACSSTIVGLRGQGLLHCWQSIVWKVESGPGPVSWEVCFITAEETFCFPFSKDFQHSLLQSWPLFMKKHRAQVDVMEHIKVLLWLWCLLMIVVWAEGYWEDNPHVKCSLWKASPYAYSCITLMLQLYVRWQSLIKITFNSMDYF